LPHHCRIAARQYCAFTVCAGQRAIPDSMGFACRGRRCQTEWYDTDHSWCNGKRVNRPLGSWNTMDNWSAIARNPPAFRQAAHQRLGKAKGLAAAWKPPGEIDPIELRHESLAARQGGWKRRPAAIGSPDQRGRWTRKVREHRASSTHDAKRIRPSARKLEPRIDSGRPWPDSGGHGNSDALGADAEADRAVHAATNQACGDRIGEPRPQPCVKYFIYESVTNPSNRAVRAEHPRMHAVLRFCDRARGSPVVTPHPPSDRRASFPGVAPPRHSASRLKAAAPLQLGLRIRGTVSAQQTDAAFRGCHFCATNEDQAPR